MLRRHVSMHRRCSLNRRELLIGGAGAALLAGPAAAAESTRLPRGLPDGTLDIARFSSLPDKGRLIRLSDRPPNYATPPEVFTEAVTPRDRFFVRYHLVAVSEGINFLDWTLSVAGDGVATPVRLTLADLLDMPQAEVMVVCQCAGNRRGLINPHVPGVQWPDGAVGCALWRGPALRDVLKRANVKAGTVEVAFDGADSPILPATPRYKKSIPIEKTMDAKTIVAIAMNGAPLPRLNGLPARLIVPGWAATYWMKHLVSIDVRTQPLDSFWMRRAYRLPAGLYPVRSSFASQATESTVPITDLVVGSMIADPLEGQELDRSGFVVRGVAWDGGSGISRVEVSLDNGKTWWDALLDQPLGPYAFRRFSLHTGWIGVGTFQILCRATSNAGERQPTVWKANPGGYHFNLPRPVTVSAK